MADEVSKRLEDMRECLVAWDQIWPDDVRWLLNTASTLLVAVQVAGGTVSETPTGVSVSGMPFLRTDGGYTEVDVRKQRDVDHG